MSSRNIIAVAALTAGVSLPGVGPVTADSCLPVPAGSAAPVCDGLTRATDDRLPTDDEKVALLVTRTAQRLGLTGLDGRTGEVSPPAGTVPSGSALSRSAGRDEGDGRGAGARGKAEKGGKGHGRERGKGSALDESGRSTAKPGETTANGSTGTNGAGTNGTGTNGTGTNGAGTSGGAGAAPDGHRPERPAGLPNPAGLPDVSSVHPAPDLPGLPVLPVMPTGKSFAGVPVAGAAASTQRPAGPDRQRIAPRTHQKSETLPDVPGVPGLPEAPALNSVDGVLPDLDLD